MHMSCGYLAIEVVEDAVAGLEAELKVALIEQVLLAFHGNRLGGNPMLPNAMRQPATDFAQVASTAAALGKHLPLLVMVGRWWRSQELHGPPLGDALERLQGPLDNRQRRLFDVGVLVGGQRPPLALLPPHLLFLLLNGPRRWIRRSWRPRRRRVG